MQCGLSRTWPDSLTQAFWGDARSLSLLSPLRAQTRGWEDRLGNGSPLPPSQRPASIVTMGLRRVPRGCSGAGKGPSGDISAVEGGTTQTVGTGGRRRLLSQARASVDGPSEAAAEPVAKPPGHPLREQAHLLLFQLVTQISLKMLPKANLVNHEVAYGCGGPCWAPVRAAGLMGDRSREGRGGALLAATASPKAA